MPQIQVDALSFSYPGKPPILHDWSELFVGGEMVALTGPSGRGKSTLLYLLGLMATPTSGEVIADGRRTARESDRQRARMRAEHYGFVFQDAVLDQTRSVIDNVVETALYRSQSRREATYRALELLERFDVRLRANHKPGEISGGQAQRIALCRGLLNSPRYVLADEPTGNLDQVSAQTVIAALKDHSRTGNVVIVATHDRDLIAASDRRIDL